jgi:hypothetical protein
MTDNKCGINQSIKLILGKVEKSQPLAHKENIKEIMKTKKTRRRILTSKRLKQELQE